MLRRLRRASLDRKLEAAAIWTSHGLADASTTALAYFLVGGSGEANPVVAALLAVHVGVAAAVILGVTAVVTLVYVVAADVFEVPSSYAFIVSLVGVLVAVGNLAAVFLSHT